MTDVCPKHGAPVERTQYACGCYANGDPIPLALRAYEGAALTRAMQEAGGDAQTAARLLGVSKSTFYRKLSENPYTQRNWFRGRRGGQRG